MKQYHGLNIPDDSLRERYLELQRALCKQANSTCNDKCDKCLYSMDNIEMFITWKKEELECKIEQDSNISK